MNGKNLKMITCLHSLWSLECHILFGLYINISASIKDYFNVMTGLCSGQMESFIMVLVEGVSSLIRSSKLSNDIIDILK